MSDRGLRVERVRFGDPGFAQAKRLEYEIFGLANNFTSATDDAAGEMTTYRPWERTSEFHVAYPRGAGERPIGIARYLRHDPALGMDSFSTLRDFRQYRVDGGPPQNHLFAEWDTFFQSVDPRHVAELATQAVLPGYRGGGVIERVWWNFISASRPEGVRIWTMALVLPLFRWYRSLLPEAVVAIGQMIPDYVGADSVPAMLRLDHPTFVDVLTRYAARPGALFDVSFAASPVAAGIELERTL